MTQLLNDSMTITNRLIKLILILLLIFTPVAFGSVELWAFSIMQLGILFIVILWAIQSAFSTPPSEIRNRQSAIPVVLLSLFLCLILFQMIPLPSGILKMIFPKTYELRSALSLAPSPSRFELSFVPFLTQIEFFKWFSLAAFFFFLLNWKGSDQIGLNMIPLILLLGVGESLYGMFEFFSGHCYILHLEAPALVSAVTGTFINRNNFAGYLLMVIPLSIGYLFSRGALRTGRSADWRDRLSNLDGKTLLIGFGVMVMVLGLLFSASRMGILSLLLSFSLIGLLFRNPGRGERFSRTSVFLLGLALLWAAWIGLDAVISRFLFASEDFESRWAIWTNTFQMIKDFPIFGSGLGTFSQVFPMYRSFHIRGVFTHAENDFLQLASEAGLLGFGLLLILFLYFSYEAISGIRLLSHRDSRRYIGIGGMVGILALIFHSLVEKNIQIPANAFLLTFIWALILRIVPAKRED